MRKRRESDQQKPKETEISSERICCIVLFLVVLCSWMIPSNAVYGFDVSGMDSFDTGGFDMNVGEGTGQLPEDWEESYAGEGSDDSNWNREEGNTEEHSAAWAESENDQEESAQWNLDFQTDEARSQEESLMENGNIPEEADIADTPAEKLTETPIPTKLPMLTEQPIPIQTVAASPSVTLTQKPVRKSATDASKREKKQNPALSYYRTEPTGTPDKKSTMKAWTYQKNSDTIGILADYFIQQEEFMYKAIFFDLDGTLTESGEGITKSVQYALEKLGVSAPDLEPLKVFVGPPLLEQFMKYAGFDKETAQKGIEYYRERYSEKGMYENTVYPGVENTLAELKRRGYRLAVASAKPTFYVTQIMDHFNLSRYFEVIAGTDLNGPKVTKSQVIEEALERMSLSDHRDQVIMVGDREHDILGARRCGIQCVAVSYGYGSREELEKAQPLQIVASADELLNFFV